MVGRGVPQSKGAGSGGQDTGVCRGRAWAAVLAGPAQLAYERHRQLWVWPRAPTHPAPRHPHSAVEFRRRAIGREATWGRRWRSSLGDDCAGLFKNPPRRRPAPSPTTAWSPVRCPIRAYRVSLLIPYLTDLIVDPGRHRLYRLVPTPNPRAGAGPFRRFPDGAMRRRNGAWRYGLCSAGRERGGAKDEGQPSTLSNCFLIYG
jgi:hypothetical protein